MADLQKQNPAGGRGFETTHTTEQTLRLKHSADPVQTLLGRLDGVQTSGKGWRARCPACDGKSRKLSIGTSNDGMVLVHCFGGCAVADVLAAVGLALADLYPDRGRDTSPMGRRERTQAMQAHAWGAALGVLANEAEVVALAGDDVAAGKPLNDADLARLALALDRIRQARAVCQ